MSYYDCPSIYCRNWGDYEYCHCLLASRSGSVATVQECRAYRKMMKDKNTDKKEKDL